VGAQPAAARPARRPCGAAMEGTGPWVQGDVRGPSPSGQAERARSQSGERFLFTNDLILMIS